jgi:uncharacterized protein
VHVGISIDGPGELNDVRWAGTLARTREATAKTEANIERLCREGMPPSLIVTLHRGNAVGDRLSRLEGWFRELEALGVTSARLHVLEVDEAGVDAVHALTDDENLDAFGSFLDLESELTTLRFDIFTDLRNLLRGEDESTTCVWNACDPLTTQAVRGVEGFGQASNCGRTNKDGIDFVKSASVGYERYLALRLTPQEHGGCKGCRFFLMCKGQCPGTSIDGDWRNRSSACALWKGLFRRLEEQMLDAGEVPLTASPDRVRIEERFVELWTSGRNSGIAQVRRTLDRGDGSAGPAEIAEHGDVPHGDIPHGDA